MSQSIHIAYCILYTVVDHVGRLSKWRSCVPPPWTHSLTEPTTWGYLDTSAWPVSKDHRAPPTCKVVQPWPTPGRTKQNGTAYSTQAVHQHRIWVSMDRRYARHSTAPFQPGCCGRWHLHGIIAFGTQPILTLLGHVIPRPLEEVNKDLKMTLGPHLFDHR